MKILFLGYGKMGSTLGEAWLTQEVVDRVIAIDPHAAERVYQAELLTHVNELHEFGFDYIVVAVKPALVPMVLASLPAQLLKDSCIISLAAGVAVQRLCSALNTSVPVLRVMPNTAVQVLAGCTGIYTSQPITNRQHKAVSALFGAVGHAYWLDEENQLDAITAISGSGPAYYHLFSEALAEAAVALGLPEKMANELAKNTAFGAAKLQCMPNSDLVSLRQMVTSPNGTTHAAIETFEQASGLRELVKSAATAAYHRSVQLNDTGN